MEQAYLLSIAALRHRFVLSENCSEVVYSAKPTPRAVPTTASPG